jgi:TonB family protein
MKLEKRKAGLTVIVLDACRDTGGLGAMRAGPGSLIAFAASPGERADNGPLETTDLFTKEFLDALSGPSQHARELFYCISESGVGEVSLGSSAPFTGHPYRVGGPVSAPRVISQVNPQYSEEARQARLNGTVTLALIVGVHGDVSSVKVLRGLGMGLDEKAIEAAKKWKFMPGMKGGHPVPVIANVEMHFRI